VVVAVSADEFLAWASRADIGFDPRYPGTDCLCLLPPPKPSRFWVLPDHPYSIPHLVSDVLDGLDPWEAAYLWPRIGQWPALPDTRLPNERVRDVVWRGAGMPEGWSGAARVGRDEWPAVVAALFASLALGGDPCSDLYFVPDHGRQIVWAGHHDAIHVECADEARVVELVRHMEAGGLCAAQRAPGRHVQMAGLDAPRPGRTGRERGNPR
jgi:hypothetical protein